MNFKDFYDITYISVFRYFYYRGVKLEDNEDLSQDCYILFYKKYLSKLDNSKEAQKILFGIVKNKYKESWRKTEKLKQEELYKPLNFSPDNLEEDFIKHEELKKQIKLALAHIPARQREVIEHRYLSGRTREETGGLMNLKPKEVHTYQKRAIKSLKKYINNN